MHYRSILRILGFLLLINALALLIPGFFALLGNYQSTLAFLGTFTASALTGILLVAIPDGKETLDTIDGCAAAFSAWLLIALFGAMPYVFSPLNLSFADGFFESVSGFTTTGSTVIADIESVERPLLLWRSMSQWFGGMGILVLALAILPYFYTGGAKLFAAETPDPQSKRFTPRIEDTSKLLWRFYFFLTLFCFGLMLLSGLNWFDALNHALTTVSTGGFSTKNNGINAFHNPALEWIMIAVMIYAAINFSLHLNVFRSGGRIIQYFKNSELRFFLTVVTLATALLIFSTVWHEHHELDWYHARRIIFQTVSLSTSSGFYLYDYSWWPAMAKVTLLILIFIGGCSGSSAGGAKAVRMILVFKYINLHVLRIAHPSLVRSVKIDRNSNLLEPKIVSGIIGFLMAYWTVAVFMTLIISHNAPDFETTLSVVISALSNIGPALGKSSTGLYDYFDDLSKYTLAFGMLLGRLELFTALVLFFPKTWRR